MSLPKTKVINIRSRQPYHEYIGRANRAWELKASIWANPDRDARRKSPEQARAEYLQHILSRPDLIDRLLELQGKTLACWCKQDDREVFCHGDVLVDLVEVGLKVVFLDFDGVLVTLESLQKGRRRPAFARHSVNALNTITDATGAVIVVTSSWRGSSVYPMAELLRDRGVRAPVVGVTPRLERKKPGGSIIIADTRAAEIQDWLSRHIVEHFIILDDEQLGGLDHRLIRTDYENGLTAELAARAICDFRLYTKGKSYE
jgi:hypothetical protein